MNAPLTVSLWRQYEAAAKAKQLKWHVFEQVCQRISGYSKVPCAPK